MCAWVLERGCPVRLAVGRQCDTGAGGWHNITEAAVHSACLLCCGAEQLLPFGTF